MACWAVCCDYKSRCRRSRGCGGVGTGRIKERCKRVHARGTINSSLRFPFKPTTSSPQAPIVKLQITTLAAKLLTLNPTHSTLRLLAQYVFSLARYDRDYDVRDRARMAASLLAGIAPGSVNATLNGFPAALAGEGEQEVRPGVVLRREQVRLVLFEGKSVVADVEDLHGHGTLRPFLPSHHFHH